MKNWLKAKSLQLGAAVAAVVVAAPAMAVTTVYDGITAAISFTDLIAFVLGAFVLVIAAKLAFKGGDKAVGMVRKV